MGEEKLDWETAYDQRDWEALDKWARNCEDKTEPRKFLALLKAEVPKRKVENGFERYEEPIPPKEQTAEWSGGAEILLLGELEACLDGEPISELEEWPLIVAQVSARMRGFLEAKEPTKGHASLTRRAHAQEVLDYFEQIEREAIFSCGELEPFPEPDCADIAELERVKQEHDWLKAVIAQAAIAAFRAGVHTRAADGKHAEGFAVRGAQTLEAASLGGKMRAAEFRDMSSKVIAAMDKRISEGSSKSEAAREVAEGGLGASAEANRKLFYRAKKKTT